MERLCFGSDRVELVELPDRLRGVVVSLPRSARPRNFAIFRDRTSDSAGRWGRNDRIDLPNVHLGLLPIKAVDFSGNCVIHLAAGVSGFVAAAVIDPRIQRDRDRFPPKNLLLADPRMLGTDSDAPGVWVTGLFLGNRKQVLLQLPAAGFIIALTAIVTFVILKIISILVPLRMDQKHLLTGDPLVDGEEAYVPQAGAHVEPATSRAVAPLANEKN